MDFDGLKNKVEDVVDDLKEKLPGHKSAGDKVGDAAGDAKDDIGDAAGDTRDHIGDAADDIKP